MTEKERLRDELDRQIRQKIQNKQPIPLNEAEKMDTQLRRLAEIENARYTKQNK